MARNFQKREEDEKLIQHFETSIRNLSNELFEIHSYKTIIEYYITRSKYKKALIAVEQAVAIYSFSDELLLLKAQIFSGLKKYEEALSLLEKVKSIHPHDLEIYFTMGSVLSIQEKHEEAIELYQKALTFAEEDMDEIHYQIGLSHQSLKKYTAAAKAYKKAININIAHKGSLYELAFCLDLNGQLESSLSYYKKFIDEIPYSSTAWHNLGTVYEKLEKYKKALNAYEYAVAIDDTFASAYFNMGHCHLHLNQNTEALNTFLKTIDLEGPSPELYCALGTTYENLAQYSLGIKYFQKASKIDSFNDEAWFGIGSCLAKQEKWCQALHFFTKAIKLSSQNSEYWKALASSEFKIGNIISSIGAYEEASCLAPEDNEIWLDWSFIYYGQGEYEKAIKVIYEGLNEQPHAADLLYRMVVYLIENRAPKEAFRYLEKALVIDFDKHPILFTFFSDTKIHQVLLRIINKFEKN